MIFEGNKFYWLSRLVISVLLWKQSSVCYEIMILIQYFLTFWKWVKLEGGGYIKILNHIKYSSLLIFFFNKNLLLHTFFDKTKRDIAKFISIVTIKYIFSALNGFLIIIELGYSATLFTMDTVHLSFLKLYELQFWSWIF